MQNVETGLSPDKQVEIRVVRNEVLTNFTLSALSSLQSGLSSVDKNPIFALRAATPHPSRKIISSILEFDIDNPRIENDNLRRKQVEDFLTEGLIETARGVVTKVAREPHEMLNENEGKIFELLATMKTADGKALSLRTILRNHFFNRALEGKEKVKIKTATVVYKRPAIVSRYEY